MNNKALVLLSGGQDSTTCLFWAKQKFDEIAAVGFYYGQRHETELMAAKNICEEYNIPFTKIDLSVLNTIAPSGLTRKNISVAGTKNNLPSTFTDGRNTMFLTCAAVLAKQMDYNNIVTGVCQTDYNGYPDCRDVFIKSLNVTLNLGLDYAFNIHTPLMNLSKTETWKLAADLGILDIIKYETVTCYHGFLGVGCTECPACKLRLAGYKEYEKTLE